MASFHYPFSKPELLQKWITFTDQKDWTINIYEKHFHEDAVSRGLQRVNLIPTKKGPHCGKRQLNEPNIEFGENHFRLEIWSQISCLISRAKTASSNAEIEGKHCPPAFQIRKTKDSVTFCKITRLCLMSENFQLFLKQSTSTKICV